MSTYAKGDELESTCTEYGGHAPRFLSEFDIDMVRYLQEDIGYREPVWISLTTDTSS